MEITINLNDLDDEETRRLASIFKFLPNYNEDDFMEKIAKCATIEYTNQFLKDISINEYI